MHTFLPPADWTRREDLAALAAAIGEEHMRWVGGAVRDTLLGTAVKDIDAATTLLPDHLVENLGQAGIKTIPTGIAHGTITAALPGGAVEITTLRRDVATDGRRATISFTTDWREDAARRDFTINALYVHPVSLQISDYFSGLADLAARRVRFIGDARERICEDHLRILRYYRFQARFGSVIDDDAESACAALAQSLKGLSRERISAEFLALLGLPDPVDTLARMAIAGVLFVILPETDQARIGDLETLREAERQQGAKPHALRRLAALLPADQRIADRVAARLRLSNVQRKHLIRLARRCTAQENARALAYREGMPVARDLLILAGADTQPLHNWTPPDFPLGGRDILARGIPPGPQVAHILQRAEKRWIAENFPDISRVQQILEEILA